MKYEYGVLCLMNCTITLDDILAETLTRDRVAYSYLAEGPMYPCPSLDFQLLYFLCYTHIG